ncbi:hypothetical protein H2199_004305 [Coniosporium tulheliwenetii]|uniref:Uncharacterized protein n=1 Tax=Coniosporium tulheliwenetii TaxID=3383036 RepID=A0ACC2Z7K3_9PEZI|nr:hypothetical protein H2199_004305 [Cladosporium sp. JES 115]
MTTDQVDVDAEEPCLISPKNEATDTKSTGEKRRPDSADTPDGRIAAFLDWTQDLDDAELIQVAKDLAALINVPQGPEVATLRSVRYWAAIFKGKHSMMVHPTMIQWYLDNNVRILQPAHKGLNTKQLPFRPSRDPDSVEAFDSSQNDTLDSSERTA